MPWVGGSMSDLMKTPDSQRNRMPPGLMKANATWSLETQEELIGTMTVTRGVASPSYFV